MAEASARYASAERSFAPRAEKPVTSPNFGDGRSPSVGAPPTDEGHGSESTVESAPTNAGPEAPICPFFVRGNCRYDSKCWKRHARVVVATKAQQGAAVCWNSGRGCKKGENCRFRHYAEPMSG